MAEALAGYKLEHDRRRFVRLIGHGLIIAGPDGIAAHTRAVIHNFTDVNVP